MEAVVRAFALRRVPTSQLRRDLGLARLMRRFSLQQVEGITAGRELIYARMVQPEPLSTPLHESTALNEEAEELVGEEVEPGE